MVHTVLARQNAELPHVWMRADWTVDRWSSPHGVSTSLRALHDGLGGGVSLGNLTISPRSIDELISAAPEEIGLPSGASALIFAPVAQPGADHMRDYWAPIILEPGSGHYRALKEQTFTERVLGERVKAAFEAAFEGLTKQAHYRHEIWVRRDLSAAAEFPLQWPPYVQRSGDAPPRPDNLTPQQLAERKRKNALAKKASHGYENARIANLADAKRHADSVVAAVRAAREHKKSVDRPAFYAG